MNILLWVLQILLALHTVMGAIWKFMNPAEKAVPSLKAIPHAAWIGLSVVELGLAAMLVLPALGTRFGIAAPVSATAIALIMVLYCVIHLAGGAPFNGQIIYWGVVAVICAFIAFGRFALKPH